MLRNAAGANLQGNSTVNKGTVVLGDPKALGTGALNLSGSAMIQGLVDLSGSNRITSNIIGGVISASDGFGVSGTKNIELGGTTSWNGSGNRVLTNALASGSVLTVDSMVMPFSATVARDLTLSGTGETYLTGPITNGTTTYANTLTMNGSGLAVLSGSNSYLGATTITSGTMQFAKAVSLYNGSTASWTAANIKVASGATLALNVGGPGEFSATDISTLLGNLGALGGSVASGQGLGKGSIIAFDTGNAGSPFMLIDGIKNSTGAGGGAIGLIKLGSGTLTLGGSSSFTGGISIVSGTVKLAGNDRLPGTVSLSLNGSNASFDLDLYSQTVGALSGAGIVHLGTGTLTVSTGTGATSNFNGVFTGTGNLIKDGPGTLVLAGTTGHSGNFTVAAGQLSVGAATLSDRGAVILAGGSLNLNFSGTDTIQCLFLGGICQRSGTWGGVGSGAANTTPLITGPGILNVTAGSYEAWAALNGLTGGPGRDSGFSSDPDGDGIPNGLELVFGGNPLAGGDALPQIASDADALTYSFSRSHESESLVALVVQWSCDLQSWNDVPVGAASSGPDANGVTLSVTQNGSSLDTVVATIPRQLEKNGKIFVRLRATHL